MAQGILVFIESKGGEPIRASLEALGAARHVASTTGEPVCALVLGADAGAQAEKVGAYGPDKVLVGESPALDAFSASAYAKAIAAAAKAVDARAVFIGGNLHGRGLAARVSARLDAGQISDCTEIHVEGQEVHAVRPVYAGKAMLKVKPVGEPWVLTPRPNMFPPPASDGSAGAVEPFDTGITDADIKAKVLSFEKKESDRPELTEAGIIVSGGRGMKGPENFHLVESLAGALGAAVGASRAVVDAGWRPHSDQVGQTGKTVSPNLYVACGISGAIQHLAGMSSSKVIVAINKDKEAPIFKVADYGIVGDVFEVLPALTAEVEKAKATT